MKFVVPVLSVAATWVGSSFLNRVDSGRHEFVQVLVLLFSGVAVGVSLLLSGGEGGGVGSLLSGFICGHNFLTLPLGGGYFWRIVTFGIYGIEL